MCKIKSRLSIKIKHMHFIEASCKVEPLVRDEALSNKSQLRGQSGSLLMMRRIVVDE